MGRIPSGNLLGVTKGVGQQQTLLDRMFECESLAQHVADTTRSNALMEHAVELCQNYLRTMLDKQHDWQRLQRTEARETDLEAQLERIQEASRQSIRGSTVQDADKQTRYWDTIGSLITEVLQLSHQKMPHQNQASPPATPLLPAKTPSAQEKCDCKPSIETDDPITTPSAQQELGMKLTAHLFGEFKANLNGREIKRWPRGKGLKIFKYLLLHRSIAIPKIRLMEAFWPDIETQAARNNLNVFIYNLRQDLSRYHKTFPFVCYQNGNYLLNADLSIWVDVEAFDQHIRSAQQHDARHETGQAVAAYRYAEALYQGDCLQEETHDEWAALIRQAYRAKYQRVLEYLAERLLEAGDYQECASLWQKAVALDSCNEEAHRHIMYCYLQMGQRQMAMRQYQLCAGALKKELGLEPSPKTLQLLEQIRQANA